MNRVRHHKELTITNSILIKWRVAGGEARNVERYEITEKLLRTLYMWNSDFILHEMGH